MCACLLLIVCFCFVDLIGNYYVDKHELVHLSKCPPMMDERLAKWTEKVVPIAVVLHGFVGFMSYEVYCCGKL